MDDFDVKKARVRAQCDEEERVEKPDESEDHARFAKLRRWLHGVWKAGRRLIHENCRWMGSDETEQRERSSQRCASGVISRCAEISEVEAEYEAGDKHRQALLRGLGFNDDSKTVNRAAMKKEKLNQDEDPEILGAEEAKQFRSLAATLNFMSLYRSDVQHAAKEVCRKMANPTRRSWKGLKKAGRYLKEAGNASMW